MTLALTLDKPMERVRRVLGISSILTLALVFLIAVLMALITMYDIRRERTSFYDNLEKRGDFLGSGLTEVFADHLYHARFGELQNVADRVIASLQSMIDSIAAEVQRSQPERQVRFDIAEGLADQGDGRLLVVVLENLLSNSWKFTAKQPQGHIEFGAERFEGVPAYFARDNGAGFDMAYSGKLFGAFQRLHPASEFEGTGVGLAIVQRVIHRHGGKLRARHFISRLKQGSGMEVEGKLILLVEDNSDEEALTLRALDRSGIDSQVVVARDGAEALDFLFGTGAYAGRDTAIMPTVTFLDLRLPKIDGLEVLQRMRVDERTKLLPMVTLSSSDGKHDITTSYESKANSYIRKPVSFTEFTEAVRQLGQYWMELNVPPGI